MPEQDIFFGENQQRLIEAMTALQVKMMQGGHLACVMRAQEYIEEIRAFLPECYD